MTDERANVEQARAWEGADGDNWTDNEELYNDAVRFITPVLLDAAAPTSRARVLDVGCGCGETTRLAARVAAHAAGIDLSSRMIERARQRAREEGLANVTFEHGDAQTYAFEPASFDVMLGRYGATFFDRPVDAFRNVAASLAGGGRIAFVCWREIGRNEWIRAMRDALAAGRDLPQPPPGVPSPFAFADDERVRSVLEQAGFASIDVEPLDAPVYLGSSAGDAFDKAQRMGVVRGLLADLDAAARARALDALRDAAARHVTPEGVLFESSSWLVRAVAAR